MSSASCWSSTAGSVSTPSDIFLCFQLPELPSAGQCPAFPVFSPAETGVDRGSDDALWRARGVCTGQSFFLSCVERWSCCFPVIIHKPMHCFCLRDPNDSSWLQRWMSTCQSSCRAARTLTNSWLWWWASPHSPTRAILWCPQCGGWCSTFSPWPCSITWTGWRRCSCILSRMSFWSSALTSRKSTRKEKSSECAPLLCLDRFPVGWGTRYLTGKDYKVHPFNLFQEGKLRVPAEEVARHSSLLNYWWLPSEAAGGSHHGCGQVSPTCSWVMIKTSLLEEENAITSWSAVTVTGLSFFTPFLQPQKPQLTSPRRPPRCLSRWMIEPEECSSILSLGEWRHLWLRLVSYIYH